MRKALITFTANVADALFTLYWVRSGLATEANPVMEIFLNHSNTAFLAVKIGLVGLFVLVLFKNQDRAVPRIALGCFSVLYLAIVGWHLYGVTLCLGWCA